MSLFSPVLFMRLIFRAPPQLRMQQIERLEEANSSWATKGFIELRSSTSPTLYPLGVNGLKGLGHAVFRNFSTDQIVIELS